MPRVRLEIVEVLVRDLEHLAVDDERELRTAADARERALAIGHLALAFSGLLVLRAAQVVADLSLPCLFRWARGHRNREHERERADRLHGGDDTTPDSLSLW